MATKANTKSERKTRRSQTDKPKQAQSSAPDALELLKQDHREVEEMFDEFSEMEDDDERKGEIAGRICRALEVHAEIEEQIFYPRAREATKDDDLIDEAIVEHASVKHLIGEIEAMEVGEELYDAKIQCSRKWSSATSKRRKRSFSRSLSRPRWTPRKSGGNWPRASRS